MSISVNNIKVRRIPELSSSTLRELCWRAGYSGVVGLARHLGRSRVTIHRAVRWPDQFGPTYELIRKALL